MGRILVGCLALAMSSPVVAQQINGAEYFFDTDPGPGLATGLSVPEGATSSSLHTVSAAALAPGFHSLNVRYRDTNGIWGLTQGRVLYVSAAPLGTSAPGIAAAEYFLDTDPGPGAGVSVPVPTGNTSTALFTVDAAALTPGFHKLGVRYKNAAGVWGLAEGRSFFVTDPVNTASPSPEITAAEYFIDTDPGPGAGTAVPVPSGNTSTSAFTINALALPTGFHTLNVRYRNADSVWGIATGRLFYMSEPLTGPGPAPSIVAAEYFFDTDPGVRAATALTITPGSTFSDQVLIDASALAMGAHVLTIRVQDADGNWSVALSKPFTVTTPPPVDNDTCATAIELILHTAEECPGQAVSSTTLGATGAGGIPCQSGTPADVWYTVNSGAAQSVGVTLTPTTAGGLGLRVLDGCSGTQLYCGTGTAHAFNVAAPTALMLQVFTVAQGTFSICVHDATSVEDCLGVPGGSALPGTACDDANASTIDEVYDANCACIGYDCLGVANGNAGPGTPCLAGTGPTGVEFYGAYNAQCECAWTDCNGVPNGPAFSGQACNDGSPGSPTSYLNASCVCVPYDCAGVPNGPLMIGAPCAAGTYPSGAINPMINASCQCTWTDCYGTVNGTIFPGVACNDNNAQTSNDVFQANCVCAGVILDCAGVVNGPAVAGTPCTLTGETGTWSASCVCIIPRPDLTVQAVTAAPSLVTPGDSVEVSWSIANVGVATSARNWTERIYARSASGQNPVLLRQVAYVEAGSLAVGASVARSRKVLIPVQFNAGDQCVFRVEIIPDASIIEVAGGSANNSAVQTTAWSVAKLLYVVPSTLQLAEGSSSSVSVRRTGSTDAALTVNAAITNAARFTIPATITIPAGQYAANLSVWSVENALLEGTVLSTLTTSAAGFNSANATVSIVDNEQPTLSFVGFPTSAMEGNSYTFQVATNLVQPAPLTVTLTTSNSQRFPLPASVVIPQGATSANITVNLQQDIIPELNISVTVQAGATGHSPANTAGLVADDDVPGLELVLNTGTISEAGGPSAVSASLRRTAGTSPIAFTASLSANFPSTLILPASLSLAAGQMQVNFNIGVVDNTLSDGARNVTITAALVMPSCGCGAPPTSAGYVTASLVVLDNDGPALTVIPDPLTLAEGQSPAGQLRVQRNSSTSSALLVSLTSTETGEATVPATATIPIGSAFVDVPITTINDGTSDGSKIVYFNASAAGFSPGVAWVMVTDVNKPDLQISASVTENIVPVLGGLGYSFTVTNSGFATAPSGVLVRGYLSANTSIEASDAVMVEHYLSAALPAGSSVTIQGVATVPDLPGNQNLLFTVNPQATITELLLTNNTAIPLALSVQPSYSATAHVVEAAHLRGNPIPIVGSAQRLDGSPATNVQVEVYIIASLGLRREVMTTTDAAGDFTASFVPLTNEVGHFTVGAAFPDLNATAPQDAFDILGVRVNNGALPQFFFPLGDTLVGTLPIRNLSDAPLAQLTIMPVDMPDGAVMTFGTIPLLSANATAELPYTITGTSASPGTNFQEAVLKVTTAQGDIQPCYINYYCQTPQGFITAIPSAINTTVSASMGERLVELLVVNTGAGPTGNVSVSLPQANWLNSVTPLSMPSIAPGDSALIILRFVANGSLPFNFAITGTIAVNTTSGNDIAVPFSLTKVSETVGTILVDVENQFTYFAEGQPMVEGALVKIKNYYTGAVYAEGLTGVDGRFTAVDVPEGTHRITVEKAQHLTYSSTIEVNPGASVQRNVFLTYQAVTFSWTVVPTTIEDSYTVVLSTNFQTNIPIPVVTVEGPDSVPHVEPGEPYAFTLELENHGLVTAENVQVILPTSHPAYEFLTTYQPAPLAALSSVTVPVVMRVREQGLVEGAGASTVEEISQFLGMSEESYDPFRDADVSCREVWLTQYEYACNEENGFVERTGNSFMYSEQDCSSGPDYGDDGLVGWSLGDIQQGGAWDCAVCGEDITGAGNQPNGPGGAITNIADCRQCKEGFANALGNAAMGCVEKFVPLPPLLPANPPEDITFDDVLDEVNEHHGDLLLGNLEGSNVFVKNIVEPFKDGKCIGTAYVNDGAFEDYASCVIPKVLPKLIPAVECVVSIGSAALDCFLGASGISAFASENHSTVPEGLRDLGSNAFEQMSLNMEVIEDHLRAQYRIGELCFGDLLLSDAFSDLAPLLEGHTTTLTAFNAQDQASILSTMEGYELDPAVLNAFFIRWNATMEAWEQEIYSPDATYPDIIDRDSVSACITRVANGDIYAANQGYDSVLEMFVDILSVANDIVQGPDDDAVCASVTVQFSQQVTMTREAFTGTLVIANGHPTDMMDSLAVDILITDLEDVPSNGLFQINTISVGDLGDVTGTGQLVAQGEEAAVFQFIPTIAAAPTAPKQYRFGGSMTYWDPYAQAMTTLPFTPITLTVNPSPDLMLQYFLERNILGDDPLTEDEVEPSVPAELAVMVENHGYGAAHDLTISSAQPEIVDNENGLAVNFQLIGSNLQGQPANLGVTNIHFGSIPPHQARVGQWYMTSSLLGHFSDYDAQVVHNNSFGNPELSLIQGAELHELTRSIRAYGALDDGITDFLVNDVFDPFDIPDVIYFSQGDSVAPVSLADEGTFSGPVVTPTLTNVLTMTPDEEGWNYVKLPDPGNGEYNIVSVTREDGQVIPLNNAWLTFVTLPVQQLPVYEDKFHFVDRFTSLSEVDYTIVWTPRDTTRVQVDSIIGVPSGVTAQQVQQLTVVFNRAIDPASFTTADMSLHFENGPDLMNPTVSIVAIDARTYTVVFGTATNSNGSFDFTVEAMGVVDTYGRAGLGVDTVSWIQYHSVPAIDAFLGFPSPALATAYSTFAIRFNLPIDATTVTPARFSLAYEGATLPAPVIVDSISNDLRTFYLSGLEAFMTEDGLYQLIVDVPAIRTTSLAFGLAPQSIALTLDNTGPVVTSLSTTTTGGIDAQHVTYIDIHLSEPVLGLSVNACGLTRNGSSLPLTGVPVSMISPTHWRVGTLGFATYNEAAYAFTLATSTLTDALGNTGAGQATVNWNVVRSTTLTVASPTIAPDMGYSGTDKVTASLPLDIGFTLNEAAQQVRIVRVSGNTETTLATVNALAAGTSTISVVLPSGGNITLKIIATALNGISNNTQFTLFADVVPLTANWLTIQGQVLTAPISEATLRFSEQLLDEALLSDAVSLVLNDVPVPTDEITLTMLNPTDLRISNLSSVAAVPGTYRLRIDLTDLAKRSSGAIGATVAELQWTIVPADVSVKLALKALLDGPYDAAAGKMHDSLRVSGLIPNADPYPGLGYDYVADPSAVLSPSLLNVQGDNAIVDWVVVELRDRTSPYDIVLNTPALLQRDGDIVGPDGSWPISIGVGADQYYIAVRHRNHLGTMTATPQGLGSTPALVDLTQPATNTYGTDARKLVGDKAVLWPGNTTWDALIKYAGEANDRDPILFFIGGTVPTNVVSDTYSGTDVNMDGHVKYTGVNNDRDIILQSIGGSVPTAVRTQQLPE